MEADEAAEMRSGLGLERSPLEFVIQGLLRPAELYLILHCRRAGDQGVDHHAGNCRAHAAGKIHSDMEKGFIRSETLSWEQLLEAERLGRGQETRLLPARKARPTSSRTGMW